MRLPNRPFANQGGVVVLAHRGWSGRFPENTMLAFRKAAELPIDGLEMDIHSTRDGVLVVCHDPMVDRTTDGTGAIQDYTLAELQQLDAGYQFTLDGGQTYPFRGRGITIPTLAEVFEAFPHLWINVDIKQKEPSIVRPFCQLIRDHGLSENLAVGSFSNKTVKTFRRACPEVVRVASLLETLWLYLLSKIYLDGLYRGRARAVQVPPVEEKYRLTIATPRFIQAAHRNNTAVHLWTINEKEEMRRFIDMGVDGLITNFPDRALEVLGRL
ncbi:MAG TPA: glycerophosphodiester phosphodiesterase [Chloroflexi bacterium]|nr:glycerophosphodiester phosphodiesterase [Chloroflexota bacterium]